MTAPSASPRPEDSPGTTELRAHGIVPACTWSAEQREAARRHFDERVFPALTPLAVDPGHPFPHLQAGSLALAVLVRRLGPPRRGAGGRQLLAIVPLPASLRRLVPLPCGDGAASALLEEVVAERVGDLFPGHAVAELAAFRSVRAGLDPVVGRSPRRARSVLRRGDAVVLELASGASEGMEVALVAALGLDRRAVRRVVGPLRTEDLQPPAPAPGRRPARRADEGDPPQALRAG